MKRLALVLDDTTHAALRARQERRRFPSLTSYLAVVLAWVAEDDRRCEAVEDAAISAGMPPFADSSRREVAGAEPRIVDGFVWCRAHAASHKASKQIRRDGRACTEDDWSPLAIVDDEETRG